MEDPNDLIAPALIIATFVGLAAWAAYDGYMSRDQYSRIQQGLPPRRPPGKYQRIAMGDRDRNPSDSSSVRAKRMMNPQNY